MEISNHRVRFLQCRRQIDFPPPVLARGRQRRYLMRPNTVKQLWAEGKPAFGAWLGTCSPLAAESMAHQGWDWLVVDGEHSPVDLQT
ncbi:MAG: hypothetical protein F4Y04_07740, partial [Chloroflexi bacterium]|nr:hypothetical protein [Chloroflexota bacterium]